jgi:hypothetical protein
MRRLPPAKRNQLIGVISATIALICLVYFMLILPQNAKNQELTATIAKETDRLQLYKKAVLQMGDTTNQLANLNEKLNQAEADVASGDPYAWSIDTMRRFKTNYHRVEIPSVGQPVQSDCELIGNFPYKEIHFSLAGSAYYHDLGKFVSDFENNFIHCRVVNLSAEPAGAPPDGGEKLNFRLEIAALVKPNN